MTIEEFISKRVEEIRRLEPMNRNLEKLAHGIQMVVEWHKNWPLLVQGLPEFSTPEKITSDDSIVYQFSQRIAWMTNQEYIKKFGLEAPAAPLLRQIASMWDNHPDFKEEWRP